MQVQQSVQPTPSQSEEMREEEVTEPAVAVCGSMEYCTAHQSCGADGGHGAQA